jgi:hypothetical protein
MYIRLKVKEKECGEKILGKAFGDKGDTILHSIWKN